MTDLLVTGILVAIGYYGYVWYRAQERAKAQRDNQTETPTKLGDDPDEDEK